MTAHGPEINEMRAVIDRACSRPIQRLCLKGRGPASFRFDMKPPATYDLTSQGGKGVGEPAGSEKVAEGDVPKRSGRWARR
jgi:hypothetical protein